MKRLLLALTVITGLAVGVVPVADAAPAAGCSKRELKGAKGEGIGASDITNGGARIETTDNGDGTSTHRLSVSVDLASAACDGVTYNIVVTDPSTGAEIFSDAVAAPVGSSTVVLASQRVVPQDSVNVVASTSSAVNPLIDRAPNTGANNVTAGVGGGQGWN